MEEKAEEVASHIKAVTSDPAYDLTGDTADCVQRELGEVLWFVDALAGELGMTLQEVARASISRARHVTTDLSQAIGRDLGLTHRERLAAAARLTERGTKRDASELG